MYSTKTIVQKPGLTDPLTQRVSSQKAQITHYRREPEELATYVSYIDDKGQEWSKAKLTKFYSDPALKSQIPEVLNKVVQKLGVVKLPPIVGAPGKQDVSRKTIVNKLREANIDTYTKLIYQPDLAAFFTLPAYTISEMKELLDFLLGTQNYEVQVKGNQTLAQFLEMLGDSPSIGQLRSAQEYLITQTAKGQGLKNVTLKITSEDENTQKRINQLVRRTGMEFDPDTKMPIVRTDYYDSTKKSPVFRLTLTMPFPRIDDHTIAPTYVPRFNYIPYDKHLLLDYRKKLIEGRFLNESPEKMAANIEAYDFMTDIAKEFVYSGGTINGMIGRYKSMQTVRDYSDLNFDPTIAKSMFDNLFRVDGPIRLKPKAALPRLVGSDVALVLSQRFENAEGELEYPKVKTNWGANPGSIWYRHQLKNRDVYFQNMVLASVLLKDLTNSLSNIPDDKIGLMQDLMTLSERPEALDEFWVRWNFIRLALMMNKPEVYERERLQDKTRLIAIYNSFAMLPIHIAHYNLIPKLLKWSEQPYIKEVGKRPTGSILGSGWTPFNGGMDHLISLIHQLQIRPHLTRIIMVYADNSYYLENDNGTVYMIEADASKAEASISEMCVRQTNAFIIRNYMQRSGISQEWIAMLMEVHPQLALNQVFVLRDLQIPANAMGSGTVGTFILNSTNMAAPIEDHVLKDFSMLNSTKTGFHPELLLNFQDMGIQIVNEGIRKMEPIKKDEVADMYRTKCLKFNGHRFPINESEDVWLPAMERLAGLQMLIFPKSGYDKDGRAKDLDEAMKYHYRELIRYRTAFFLYCWCDERYSNFVLDRAKYHYDYIFGYIEDEALDEYAIDLTEEEIEEDYGSIGLDTKLLAEVLGVARKYAIPTIYELVKIGTGKEEVALRAVKFRVKAGFTPIDVVAPRAILKEFITPEKLTELRYDENRVIRLKQTLETPNEIRRALYKLPKKPAKITEGETGIRLLEKLKGDKSIIVQDPRVRPASLKPVRPNLKDKKKIPNINEAKWFVIQRDLNREFVRPGPRLYRVPIPSDKSVDELFEMNERKLENTAYNAFITNLSMATNVRKVDIKDFMRGLPARITFTFFRPVMDETMTLDEENKDKNMMYVDPLTNSDTELHAHDVMPRRVIRAIPAAELPYESDEELDSDEDQDYQVY